MLGSSGSCAAPGNPASGYLITHDDTTIWCDAGPGTFMALMEKIDPVAVDAIVISHLHPDHCADLVAFFGYMAYGPHRGGRVPVYAPDGVVEPIAAFVGAEGGHVFHLALDFRVVDAGDEAVIDDITMRFAETHHGVPTIATRFIAGGRSLAYSADTGPGGGFPDLAVGADLILCEATDVGERGPQSYAYHLNAGEAGALGRAAGTARLILTHLSPTVDPRLAEAEATATFGRAPGLAVPGMTVGI